MAPRRTLRLNEVLCQQTEGVCEELAGGRANELLAAHENQYGPLRPDEEPSPQQLSAILSRIGDGHNPYADLALWGGAPGKKTQLAELTLTVEGTWRRVQVAGPANWEEWRKGWKVYRSAMFVAGAASVGSLDAYAETVFTLASKYSWPLVYMADVKMRRETMARRRRLLGSARRPWDTLFRSAADDFVFWTTEVREPAALGQQQGAKAENLRRQTAQWRGKGSEPERAVLTAKGPATRRRSNGVRRWAPGGKGGGRNKFGVQICFAWNRDKQGCPGGCRRSHECEKCGGPHPASAGCS